MNEPPWGRIRARSAPGSSPCSALSAWAEPATVSVPGPTAPATSIPFRYFWVFR